MTSAHSRWLPRVQQAGMAAAPARAGEAGWVTPSSPTQPQSTGPALELAVGLRAGAESVPSLSLSNANAGGGCELLDPTSSSDLHLLM